MDQSDERYEAMLEGVMNGLAESILDMPEEEFLLECEENGEDINAMAEEFRRRFLQALAARSECAHESAATETSHKI